MVRPSIAWTIRSHRSKHFWTKETPLSSLTLKTRVAISSVKNKRRQLYIFYPISVISRKLILADGGAIAIFFLSGTLALERADLNKNAKRF